MANLSPPRVSRREPFRWSEGQQLEINPNHWAGDYVRLAVPLNRKFIYDASPYASQVSISTKGSENLTQAVQEFMDGKAASFRGAGTGDAVYIDSPATDHLGSAGTEFTMMARHRTPSGNANFRTALAKGGGAGSTVWYGMYGNSSNEWNGQFDDGSAANALQVNVASSRNYGSTEDWSFSAMGQIEGATDTRFLQYNDLRTTAANAKTINNGHNWVIGNEQFRNNAWLGDVKDILVLEKCLTTDQVSEFDRDPHAIYRPKVRRGFFFYGQAAAGGATYPTELIRRRQNTLLRM